jgi:hypothetical protein
MTTKQRQQLVLGYAVRRCPECPEDANCYLVELKYRVPWGRKTHTAAYHVRNYLEVGPLYDWAASMTKGTTP